MARWGAKIAAALVSFILPFACILIPYKVTPWIAGYGATGEKCLSFLMCFGGGIFFGTFLLHVAPEVRSIVHRTLTQPNGIAYPLTDLFIGCGFFFVLYLEKLVMLINKCLVQKMGDNSVISQRASTPHLKEDILVHGQVNYGIQEEEKLGSSCDAHDSEKLNRTPSNERGQSTSEERYNDQDKDEVSAKDEESKKIIDATDRVSCLIEEGQHNLRSLILAIALSVHHIFEGLALGLQLSTEFTITLLIAVMCHETIISFSLGLQFTKSHYSARRMIITAFCYSVILPLGVVIGTMLSETQSGDPVLDLTNGIIQAFSAGTFIFVTFFEIFQEEIKPEDTSLLKVTGAAFGFLVMSLLTLINVCFEHFLAQPDQSTIHGGKNEGSQTATISTFHHLKISNFSET